MQQQLNIPQSIEMEQSILGALLIDPKIMTNVSDLITAEAFYKKEHRIIFECLKELHAENKAVGLMTLKVKLESKNLVDAAGGISYIVGLSQFVPSSANVETYINELRELEMKRSLIDVGDKIKSIGLTQDITTTDFVDMAAKMMSEVTRKRTVSQFRDLAEVIDNTVLGIEKNITSGSEVTGYATGFSNIDRMTHGFQKEDLMILAARPAVGKTAFALNLAINVAKLNDIGVAFFSKEMSAEQLMNRILSRESGIEAEKFKKGPISSTEWAKISAACNILKKHRIYFDDSADTNVNELRAKCRKLHEDGNLGCIVVDYLQLLTAGGMFGGNRQQEVSYISRTLKEMAREFRVPVLALSQLSRDVEKRDDKRPKMADLRESGSIEQDADMVLFLYREDYHDRETTNANIVELDFAKNRHGSTGKVEFKFNKECSQFNAIAYQKERKEEDANSKKELDVVNY